MKIYTVFFRRRKGSPIAYISGADEARATKNYTAVEKEHFSYNGKSVQMPVVKGSHFRGRLRQFTAERILELRAGELEKYPAGLKSAVMKTIALCYFVGNVQVNEGAASFEALGELLRADAFFRYFGYMVSSLPSVRSYLSVGFALPLVRGVIPDSLIEKAEELKLSIVDADEIKTVTLDLGKGMTSVPYPLVNVETYRVTGKLEKVEKLGTLIDADTGEVKEIIKSYSDSSKDDLNNILFSEVFSPVCDLVQKISFADNDEEMHRGILSAYLSLFEREPFVGGRVSAGYGLIDEVIVFDESGSRIEKDEEAFKKFAESIDFKKIAEIVVPKKKEEKKKK
jgi:hypothetical protein